MDQSLLQLFAYSDLANRQILDASEALIDPQLDQPFDIGRGSLRKTLLHIYAGEYVWYRRQSGHVEEPWFDETQKLSVPDLRTRFESLWPARDAFVKSLDESRLSDVQPYRDSRGSMFRATLRQMLIQGITHSTHHRAQAVNLLRRLGRPMVEVDFMYAVRQPG